MDFRHSKTAQFSNSLDLRQRVWMSDKIGFQTYTVSTITAKNYLTIRPQCNTYFIQP